MGRVLLFIGLALVALVMAAVAVTLILRPKPYRVPSEAMTPTLKVGDRVFGTDVSSPERGQIVVFHPPSAAVSSVSDDAACGAPRRRGAPCARSSSGSSDAKFISRVAKWWIPEDFAVIDEVPKTSVGKFDKKVLRKRLEEGELETVSESVPASRSA